MAYFNHAFTKIFLGTQLTAQNPNVNLVNGFLITAGIPSVDLGNTTGLPNTIYGPGTYGFFDPNTYLSVNTTYFSTHTCCPLVLASASLLSNDKIGPFHGGYKESNKSKMINPKYIQKVYRVDTCVPQQSVVSIGYTPQTAIPGLPVDNFQGGTVQSNCCYNFLCGETYYLRIDVKGSPTLRALNHNAYQNVAAYTGCCSGPTPTFVDPTTVYITWANAIIINNYLKSFVAPVVYDYTGVAWYAPGTTFSYDGLNTPVTPAQWWTNYPASAQALAWTPLLANECQAGMRLFGAYVETKFGNCSFQITDFFEKEPVRIFASLVDLNGDPCVFEGLCVYNDCQGIQGMGFGEQVVRDLILAESYLQNFFHTDIRIREITQGDQILNSINRNALYTRYFLLHSVPRYNNPTGVFDNDRYMLEIIITEPNPLLPVGNAALETFLNAWLSNCPNCVTLEVEDCVHCTIIPD
jgi:hypothetical protein